jgi:ribose 5-phosphate isomerase B
MPAEHVRPNPAIIIGADHAGVGLKDHLKSWLTAEGWQVTDIGCYDTQAVDYPRIAQAVAAPVHEGQYPFGLLVCGSGVGVMMGANRYTGVRAVLADNATIARLSREHNNANVLCLGARLTAAPLAEELLHVFLTTPFAEDRHARRVNLLDDVDPAVSPFVNKTDGTPSCSLST